MLSWTSAVEKVTTKLSDDPFLLKGKEPNNFALVNFKFLKDDPKIPNFPARVNVAILVSFVNF